MRGPKRKRQSFGLKEQLHIGAAVADALPKVGGLKDVAEKLGISGTAVRKIEYLALYKVQARLKEILNEYRNE